MFACNDLLFRRFGVGDTGDCACCAGRRETAWHVVGACDDPKAAAVRVKWAERMWAEVQKEVMRPKQALDVRVASAVRRLWSMDEDGVHLREWAVGSAEAVAGHELDGQMAKMLEAIAKAGSWAAWMGVFQPEWMQLLKAGGMGHSRARKLTTRLANVIGECRSALAKVRNERARAVRDAGREQRERELEERVRELHARDPEPAQTLDQLLESARAVKEGYRRRRERMEREVELQAQREAEERLRVRQRRKRRRTVRAREAKAVVGVAGSGNGSKCKRKRKGLGRDHGESMTQAGIADMLRGRVCTAGAVNSDTDPDSEGSEDEDRCRPRLRPGLRERHQREIEAMQGRLGRARAAAARQGRERRNGRRRLQKRRKREGGARGGGRVRGCAGARAGRRCGVGAAGGPRP